MSAEEIWLRGEGGGVFRMTLPLSPHIQQRYDAGDLVRVNRDGSPWTEDAPQPAPKRRARKAQQPEPEADDDAG